MSRIAEYKIVDYKTEIITIPAEYDDEGNIVTEAHTEEKRNPIYAMVYRDMTEAEEAEALAMAQEQEETLPSAEERIEILEQAFAEFVEEVLAND